MNIQMNWDLEDEYSNNCDQSMNMQMNCAQKQSYTSKISYH